MPGSVRASPMLHQPGQGTRAVPSARRLPCRIVKMTLQRVGKSADMYAVYKGMMHLHGKRQYDFSFPDGVFAPVKKRSRAVLPA